jgi:hypothetical protein
MILHLLIRLQLSIQTQNLVYPAHPDPIPAKTLFVLGVEFLVVIVQIVN